VSRDIGIRFTRKTWNLTTHAIDSNIDESREYVFSDLAIENRLKEFGYVDGHFGASKADPRKNLTGDSYFSDGRRLVITLSSQDVKARLIDWQLSDSQVGLHEN